MKYPNLKISVSSAHALVEKRSNNCEFVITGNRSMKFCRLYCVANILCLMQKYYLQTYELNKIKQKRSIFNRKYCIKLFRTFIFGKGFFLFK